MGRWRGRSNGGESVQRWIATVAALGFAVGAANAQEADRLPNVLVIMGDEIGHANISAYTMGPDGLPRLRTSTASPTRA
jgi:hypothetical protein